MINRLFSGKYQVQQEIAKGGMGVVYKGVHTALNRPVAIKVIDSKFSSDTAFLNRFQREARTMARLNHENIISVFDVAEDHGDYYIVMEYFPGRDIKSIILERSQIPPRETLLIAAQIANALAYAHEKGVIHRDIKPGNIMMDETGRVKLIDFGIAAAADEASVTQTGSMIGTPQYMSPEQARGDKGIDGRTDLYSMGMVLYEMVTGKTHLTGLSQLAVIAKLADEKEFSLSFSSKVPVPLQKLITSLLRKNPKDRIPNARAVLEKINRLLSTTQQINPETDETTLLINGNDPALSKPQRNILPAVAIGITAIMFIGGAGYYFTTTKNAPIVPEVVPDKMELPIKEPIPVETPPVAEKENSSANKIQPDRERIAKQKAEREAEANAAKEKIALANQARVAKEQEAQKKELEEKRKAEETKREKDRAESEKLERAQRRELLNDALANLKTGYENKDLERLKQITVMSASKASFLRQIFGAYPTIEVEISNRSQTDDAASAVVTITKLIDKNGNQVVPGEQWKNANLRLQRDGAGWGKITW